MNRLRKNDGGREEQLEIDLVYTWVNGSDLVWQEKRDRTIGCPIEKSAENCEGRYVDNDELMFSLRSVEKYAPWIRRIFIVTDNQVPRWLDTSNPKIKIVDHSEILPAEVLPTFNSVVIEHALHKIPGLSEHFLYANDDMFFNRLVRPKDFFTPEGFPVIRLIRRPLRRIILKLKKLILRGKISYYNDTIKRAADLIASKFGRWIGSKPHHNIDAYCKSLYRETAETFINEIEPTLSNHRRKENDIQRIIYSYYPIVKKKCRVEYVGRKTSFRLRNHRRKYYSKMTKLNPMLFCLNDSQYATDEDRRLGREFLNTIFPNPSSFEK